MFRIFGLACLLGAATYTFAADPQDSKPPVPTPTSKAAVTPATPAKAAPSTPAQQGGLVVAVDPATGKFRQPDASEIGVLVGPSAAGLQPAALPTFQPVGGGVGIKLPSSSMMYMVAEKTPDGKITSECVNGDQAASRVQSGELSKKPDTSKTTVPAAVK